MRRSGLMIVTGIACLSAYAGVPALDQRVDSLLVQMTLTEKIGQLNQLSPRGFGEFALAVREGRVGSVLNEVDPEVISRLQHIAVEESRLGIPLVFARDVIHGFRTILPIPLGQAATWNPTLVEQGARVAAREASSVGIRWTFSPMVDVSRDARWGRVAESGGEDPVLNGRMGGAMVRGYQTDNPADPTAIAACVKHFAGYGAAESGRDYNTTWLPLPLLRDVYFPPFEEGVRAGALTFMTSFNDINGVPSSANRWLLQDVLRDEWGFDGVIVSDWGSISDMIPAGVAADRKEATLLAAAAGVDIDMEGLCYPAHLEEWVKEGKISEETIDGMVRNVLRLKFRLGLFENPYTEIENRPVMYAPEHLETARRLAEEGTVLLKNDGILPLGKKPGKILVTGPLADAPHDQCGTWAPDREKSRSVTPLAALRRMYGREAVIYSPGVRYSRDNSGDGIFAAVEAARDADVVLCFLGEEAVLSGEAHCLASLDLKGRQRELVERLHAVGKPMVAVFMAGRPLTVGREIELSDAALYSFHGGTMAGPALANILSGDVNPSGKLPVTMARLTGQYPMYHAHKNTGRPPFWSVDIDDIPLEAEQTSTGCTSYHLDAGVEPLYPFGYGLSYTEFEFGTPTLSAQTVSKSSAVPLKVSCTVKNTGNRRGEETVQLYIRDKVASLARPVKELRDFVKISLEPGEARQIEMELSPDRLAFHGLDGSEIIEPGEFEVWMAPDSSSGEPVTFILTD